jgi:vacuolar protein sorting-associated protein 45
MALGRRPAVRVQRSSELADGVAHALENLFLATEADLHPADCTGSTLLLILDRVDDPLTPLVFPWTYQVGIVVWRWHARGRIAEKEEFGECVW